MIRKVIKMFSVIASINLLFLPITFGQEITKQNWKCGTPIFTDSLTQIALENTKLLDPATYQLMLKNSQEVNFKKTKVDTIGTIKSFFTYNFVTKSFNTVNAKLLKKGTRVQIWVDTTEIGNNHISQGVVDTLLNSLENKTPSASRDSTKGIVKLDEQYFGNPPNIDKDNLTDFLVYDIKDGWNGNTVKTYTGGYFYSKDQTNDSTSNKRDLLYIDSRPGIFDANKRDASRPLKTLAHEYQHLIHYNYDKKEISFVNEGLSEIASVISGYQLRSPSRYFADTDIPLFDWNNKSSSVLDDYSRAALFTLYYDEQFGDSVLKKVVQDTLIGDKGLNNVFGTYNSSLNEVFKNFTIANYLNNRFFNKRYGYTYYFSGESKINFSISKPNTFMGNILIEDFTAQYFKIISLIDTVQIKLIGSDVIGNIIGYNINYPFFLVDSLINSENYKLPDFDQNIDSVIGIVINEDTTQRSYDINITAKDNNTYWTWTDWSIEPYKNIVYDGDNRFYMKINGMLRYVDSTYSEVKNIPTSVPSFLTSNIFIKNDTLYVGNNAAEIYYSPDSGATWDQISTSPIIGPISGISIDNTNNIYISNYRFNHLFWLSKDNGNNWINLDNPNIFNTYTKRGYFILNDLNNNVYAFTDFNEIFYSTNMGANWTLLDDSWDKFFSFAKIDNDGNFVTETINRGLFKRDNAGVISSLGVPKDWVIRDIAFHPLKDSVMMIAVRYNQSYPDHGGIYLTNNSGKSWQRINTGLEDFDAFSIGLDKNGNAVASTSTAIHRSKSIVTGIKENLVSIPEKYILQQNYPNPFNPGTIISFQLPVRSRVTLKVYDILGREVSILVNDEKPAGNYKIYFDASSGSRRMSSGVYFYRLSAVGNDINFIQTKKMILIK